MEAVTFGPYSIPWIPYDSYSLPHIEPSKLDLAEYLSALAPDYEPYKIVQIENLSGEYNSSPVLEVRILYKQRG